MRYLIAIALAITVAATATPAAAAPAEQACPTGLIDQRDLAGIYIDPASPMRVQVFPCAGVDILWDNAYGRHFAYYQMTEPLPGGGVVGHGYRPDPRVGYLDNAYTIAVKPGTPGTVEVITISPYGQFIAMYRLRKMP